MSAAPIIYEACTCAASESLDCYCGYEPGFGYLDGGVVGIRETFRNVEEQITAEEDWWRKYDDLDRIVREQDRYDVEMNYNLGGFDHRTTDVRITPRPRCITEMGAPPRKPSGFKVPRQSYNDTLDATMYAVQTHYGYNVRDPRRPSPFLKGVEA